MKTLWMHLRELWQWMLGSTPPAVAVTRLELPVKPFVRNGMW